MHRRRHLLLLRSRMNSEFRLIYRVECWMCGSHFNGHIGSWTGSRIFFYPIHVPWNFWDFFISSISPSTLFSTMILNTIFKFNSTFQTLSTAYALFFLNLGQEAAEQCASWHHCCRSVRTFWSSSYHTGSTYVASVFSTQLRPIIRQDPHGWSYWHQWGLNLSMTSITATLRFDG